MQSDDDRTGRPEDEEELRLPNELVQELKRLDRAVAVVSPEADRRVAEAAGTHFGRRPRRWRMTRRRWAVAGSLAASLLVGVLFWRIQTPVEPLLMVATLPRSPNDVDGSGAVDILDAFALARMARDDLPAKRKRTDALARMERRGRSPAAQAEIDALAMSIVTLDGSEGKP